jgi:hypothetical protein
VHAKLTRLSSGKFVRAVVRLAVAPALAAAAAVALVAALTVVLLVSEVCHPQSLSTRLACANCKPHL